MADSGLEKIVRNVLVSASAIGLLALSGCGYNITQPMTTLPPPQAHVATFTPTATTRPEPTYAPTATLAPSPIPTKTGTPEPTPYLTPTEEPCVPEKKIFVDISEQMIYAVIDSCDGSRDWVMSSQVSTGKPGYETPIGEYKIWIKLVSTDMRGPGYYTKDVPHTMYFTKWGHAIHGAYWHNNFGHPMSHGCVNLPLGAAEWFFGWAEIGTLVIVQE